MIRALRVLSLVLAALAAVYIVSVYSSCSPRMPMQWDLENHPTWYAPKAAFFGMFAGGLLLGVALSFVRPAAAVGAAIVFSDLLLLNACIESAAESHRPMMSVGTATVIALGMSFVAAIATAVQALRFANSRAGGAPPPAPPRAS